MSVDSFRAAKRRADQVESRLERWIAAIERRALRDHVTRAAVEMALADQRAALEWAALTREERRCLWHERPACIDKEDC